VKDFSSTIVKEQLLFQEDFMFAKGEAVHEAPSIGGVTFVTDAFGPSVAAEQVASALGAELGFDIAAMAQPVVLEGVTEIESGTESENEHVETIDESSVESV
jgi:hypothetical protein